MVYPSVRAGIWKLFMYQHDLTFQLLLYPGHDNFLDELKESFVNASRVSKHTESSHALKKKLGALSDDSVFVGEFKTVIGHRKELPPDIVPEQRTTDPQ